MRELVCHVFLLRGVSCHYTAGDADVVDVFHASDAGHDIADAVERICSEAIFIETRDVFNVHESAWHVVDLVRLDINRYRDVAFDAVVDVDPFDVVAGCERDVICCNLLRYIVMHSMCAVAVIDVVYEVTSANGSHRCRHCDIDVVCRLVGEVINAREPAFAEVMRYRLEADAHITDIVAAPHDAAPVFVEGVAAVCYRERGACICCQSRREVNGEDVTALRETADVSIV